MLAPTELRTQLQTRGRGDESSVVLSFAFLLPSGTRAGSSEAPTQVCPRSTPLCAEMRGHDCDAGADPEVSPTALQGHCPAPAPVPLSLECFSRAKLGEQALQRVGLYSDM